MAKLLSILNCFVFHYLSTGAQFKVFPYVYISYLQLSHGSSHGQSGVNSRGGISVVGNPGFSSSSNGVAGSIPGSIPNFGNRNAVPGLGVSPILGNAGPRITSSMGNMVAGGNIGRMSSGGLSIPGLTSRLNLNGNSGSVGLGMQGQNRLMSGVLPQGIYFGSNKCIKVTRK
jgi:CCR4-NOT transcription complex subunit 2